MFTLVWLLAVIAKSPRYHIFNKHKQKTNFCLMLLVSWLAFTLTYQSACVSCSHYTLLVAWKPARTSSSHEIFVAESWSGVGLLGPGYAPSKICQGNQRALCCNGQKNNSVVVVHVQHQRVELLGSDWLYYSTVCRWPIIMMAKTKYIYIYLYTTQAWHWNHCQEK